MSTESGFALPRPETQPVPANAKVALAAITIRLDGPEPSADLIEAIRTYGVMEPVVLFQIKNEFWVMTGRRRIKAARAAGLEHISARVYDGDTLGEAFYHLALLGLNALRSDNPIVDLESIEALFKMGAAVEDIAASAGMSVPTVRKRLRLLLLIPYMRQAMRDGKIATAVGERVAGLPASLQEALSLTHQTEGRLTMKEVREIRRVRVEQATLGIEAAVAPKDALAEWRAVSSEVLMRVAEGGAVAGEFPEIVEALRALSQSMATDAVAA